MTNVDKDCYLYLYCAGAGPGAEDDSVTIWDIREGRLLRSFDGICAAIDDAIFCDDDRMVLVEKDNGVCWFGLGASTGDMVYTLRRGEAAACIGGKNKSIIGIFTETEVVLYNSATGEQSAVIPNPYKMKFISSVIGKGKRRNV
jgi:hypothetical protein